MTYSRGQYDDEYGRDRRPRRDVPERDERRASGGSSRYSRSSERYARYGSNSRDSGRPARSQSRPNRQHRDETQRSRQRSSQDVQRGPARSRQRSNMRDDAYDRRDVRGGQKRDMRSGQARDGRDVRYPDSRMGQRGAAQANQYSRDRYVSRPGQQRGTSVSQQNYESVRRVKPIDPRIVLALAVVAIVLAAVIIVRFVAFGGTAAEYHAVQSTIDQEKAQLAELETSNGDLQAQIDSMQGLIERYNDSGKK